MRSKTGNQKFVLTSRPTLLHQVTMLAMLKLKKRSRIDVGSLKPHTMRTSIVRMAGGYNYSISQSVSMPLPSSKYMILATCYTECGKELLLLLNAKVKVPTEVTYLYQQSHANLVIQCWKSSHLQAPSFILVGQLPTSSCPPAETLYKLPKGEDMAPWQSNRDGSMFPKLVPHHWPSPIGNSMRRGYHHFCMVRHEQAPYHFSWGLAIKNLKKEHSWVVLAWKMFFLEIAWSQSMKS